MSEDVAAVMATIGRSLSKREDPCEARNLAQDLRAMQRHLDAGEYAATSFVQRGAFDVEARTREFLSYLDGWAHQAQRWGEVLALIPLESARSVVDLLPGWAPKIELALAHRGFVGDVYLLDRNAAALAQLMKSMQLFSPRFQMHALQTDFFAPPENHFDVVVANHILDDLVCCSKAADLAIDASTLYTHEPALRRVWQALCDERGELPAFASRLARQLGRYIAPGGYVCFTHYPSLFERLHDASHISRLFAECYEAVCLDLIAQGLTVMPGAPPGYFVARRPL